MGIAQRWVQLGYQETIDMGRDRYAHMVYNTLKTRASHTTQQLQRWGLNITLFPGTVRISQAALARELGISRQTLLHTLRFLEMKKIISYKPDERGTTIRFNNFMHHQVKRDAPSKQGCLPGEHYNKTLKHNSINPKTLGIKKAGPAGSFTAAGAWTPDADATMAYLRSQTEKTASSIPVDLLADIRRLQGRA